ncbi:MAG: hypothetical protein ACRBHB_13630 [Arenicella sp.]
MNVFNYQLLLALLGATVLGFLIGWLFKKLIVEVKEKSLNEKINLQRKTIADAKVKLKQKSVELKAYESQAIQMENSLTDGLVDIEIKYSRLKQKEEDLRVKLSQLYTKKQAEIATLKTELEMFKAMSSNSGNSAARTLAGEVTEEIEQEIDEHQQTIRRLENQLKLETDVYKKRIEELEQQVEATHTTNLSEQEPVSSENLEKAASDIVDDNVWNSNSSESADDLTRINGIGPKIKGLLNDNGITTFQQIADFDDADIERISQRLGNFSGRIERDEWVKQAQDLST